MEKGGNKMTLIINYENCIEPFIIKKASNEVILHHIGLQLKYSAEHINSINIINESQGKKLQGMRNNDILMLTVKDLRDILNVSLSQAYGLVNASGFPSIKIGGRILVEKQALEAWLKKNQGRKFAI